MTANYPIPLEQTRIEIKVANSRFISTLAYTPSVDDVKIFLNIVKSEMPTAAHHVYAFRVGFGNSVIEGMSDDGEPSGTAGPPTLRVLQGSGLGDATLVTTRYFGGTKLGTGGLVRAYTDAAKTVIVAASTTVKVDRVSASVTLPYHLYETFQRVLSRYDVVVQDVAYAQHVTISIAINSAQFQSLDSELISLSAGSVSLDRLP